MLSQDSKRSPEKQKELEEKARQARLKTIEAHERVQKAETKLREANNAYAQALLEEGEAHDRVLGITPNNRSS